MFLALYILVLLIFVTLLNIFLIKNKILVNLTGDFHQKFTSRKKIPLTGGILLFLSSLFFFDQINKFFYLSIFSIFLLGFFSDLKILKSARFRLFLQTIIILVFVNLVNIEILDTRIYILDDLLKSKIFNILFVSFCVLIIINGSNFLDGLNTLNVGYYLLISLILFYLDKNFSVFNLTSLNLILILSVVYVLNFLNKLFLGDSGSYLLGFVFSIILIQFYKTNYLLSPFFIILLLWYPAFETLFSMIRKAIVKKSSMKPDADHLHQLIFYAIRKKFDLDITFANVITANIINFYNGLIFLMCLNFRLNSQVLIMFIILNIIIYIVIYLKFYVLRYKKL